MTFSFVNISDETVKMLGHCHTLNLRCTEIMDESLKMLGNVILLIFVGLK